MSQSDLILQQLSKQYRAGKTVFSGITDRFKAGDAILLTGPNGSGKTTFLKLISVNTFPTSGSVRYGDLDIHKNPHAFLKYVGLVHDEEALPQHLSAVELLEWVLRTRDLWNDKSVDQIDAIFDRLELDEARYDQIGTYSTGMRKKAQIAAALIVRPPILILDEPLRGLDSTATIRALKLFREAAESGSMLFMASHAREEGDELFNRVLKFPLAEGK